MRLHNSPTSIGVSRVRSSAREQSEQGFTLVEVLVSALIVILLSAAVAQGLIAGASFAADQRHRSQADELAQQDQERLKGLSAKQLNGLSQITPVALDNTQFDVHSTASFLSAGGSSSCGSSGTGAVAYFSTKSKVTWTDQKTGATQTLAEEDSIITPPAGGTLLTQFVDQTGNPLSGVGVSASGPDVESGTTNSNGCAIFAGLSPGSYSLTFTDSGYVDTHGNPSPLSDTATVTSSGTATPSSPPNPVTMGLAGTLTGNFTAKGSSGTVFAQADGMSWLGTGATYGMSGPADVTSSTLAAALTAGNLFPFAYAGPSYANNYQVWGGRCTQMQPPKGTDTVSVSPGSTQSAPIKEPALAVLVKYGGLRVAPADLKMSFASTSGSSCVDSWYAPVSSLAATSPDGSLASPGQPFASGATTGPTASASGQTGQYTVCADFSGHKSTALTYNTNFAAPTAVTINIPANPGSVGTC